MCLFRSHKNCIALQDKERTIEHLINEVYKAQTYYLEDITAMKNGEEPTHYEKYFENRIVKVVRD